MLFSLVAIGARAQTATAQDQQSPSTAPTEGLEQFRSIDRQRDAQVRAAQEQQRRLARQKKEMQEKISGQPPTETSAARSKSEKRINSKIPCVEEGPNCR